MKRNRLTRRDRSFEAAELLGEIDELEASINAADNENKEVVENDISLSASSNENIARKLVSLAKDLVA